MFLLISSFCNISFPCVWSSFSIKHSFNLTTVTFHMRMIGNVSVLSFECFECLFCQTDIFCILPFDLLCLNFEFSSIYRLNRIIRVRSSRPTITRDTRGNIAQRSPCLLQIESFFEFSDRLENVMAKAYIWRYSETPLEVKIKAFTDVWAVFNLQGGPHYRIPALHASPQRLCLFRGLGASGDRDHDLGV